MANLVGLAGNLLFGGGGGVAAVSAGVGNKGQPTHNVFDEDKRYFERQNKCFIINNNFAGKSDALPGYDIDESRIRDTFEWLKFDIIVDKNKTKKEMVKTVKSWTQIDYSNNDCFVCFILSHGTKNDKIFGEDKKTLAVNYLVNEMNAVKSLYNKPKLFFIQACRGNIAGDTIGQKSSANESGDTPQSASGSSQEVDDDDQPIMQKAQGSDDFIYYASSEGTVSYVDAAEGSFFVKELLLMLQAFVPGEQPLGHIVKKVNKRVAGKIEGGAAQACEARDKLTYEVYFTSKSPAFEKSEIRDAILKGKTPHFYMVYFQGSMVNAFMDYVTGSLSITHSSYGANYLDAAKAADSLAIHSMDGVGRSAIIYEAASHRVMYSKKVYSMTAEKELVDYAERHCPY